MHLSTSHGFCQLSLPLTLGAANVNLLGCRDWIVIGNKVKPSVRHQCRSSSEVEAEAEAEAEACGDGVKKVLA